MKKAVFYHAGCPVCVSAAQDILNFIPEGEVEIIHLDQDKAKVQDAEVESVQSVPALVLSNGNVLPINFGASLSDLK